VSNKEQLLMTRRLPDALQAATGRAVLLEHGWLPACDPVFAEAVLRLCRWRLLADGETLSHPEMDELTMFGIAAGHVAGEQHPLGSIDFGLSAIWHAGSWVGFAPLLNGSARRGVIRARGEALVAVLPGRAMTELLAARPEWWREMARLPYLVSQLHAGGGQDLLRRDAAERCLAVLLMLAGCRWSDLPGGPPFVAPVSQQELGERCNLSRNGVVKILQDVAATGAITLGYRQILVNDAAGLRARLAAGD
jgi:CRP-like cAMP-binding protein